LCVCLFESKFGNMERLAPGFGGGLLSCFRVGEEVLEDRQELKEELAPEVCICNL